MSGVPDEFEREPHAVLDQHAVRTAPPAVGGEQRARLGEIERLERDALVVRRRGDGDDGFGEDPDAMVRALDQRRPIGGEPQRSAHDGIACDRARPHEEIMGR